jgi:antitoxin component of MazEF toxin-antitoxin module
MQKKKMKVLYSTRSRSYSYIGGSRYTTTPKISMEGKWLETLGFKIGDAIEVSFEENSIRISLASQQAMVCESNSQYKSDTRPCQQKQSCLQ